MAAAFVALTVTLSGCSIVDDVGGVVNDVQRSLTADQELSKLTDELRARGDVDTVTETVLAVTMSAKVTVAMAKGAPPGATAEVLARVDEVMRGAEQQPFTREFTVDADSASIRQTDFEQTPIDYAAELAYWGTVKSAVGADLTFTLGPDRIGALRRTLETGTDATVVAISTNFDAIQAITAPDSAETLWRLPGIAGYNDWLGPLPDRRVLAFLASMSRVTNLLDDSVQEAPPGIWVNLPSAGAEPSPPRFSLIANEANTTEETAATWQLGLAMAREALATGLPAAQLSIYTLGNEPDQDAHAFFGECAEMNSMFPPSPVDRKFVADLVAGGADLPYSAAGLCQRFANP